jgi:plastocyanin
MSKKTTRRNLLKVAAGGSVAAGLGWAMKPGSTKAASPPMLQSDEHSHKPKTKLSGPLASATVSFGQWAADPDSPLDRHPNLAPLNRNEHTLIPDEVTIQAGGVVNFIIGGAHQIAIYDHGTRPEDIRLTSGFLVPTAAGGPAILINDPRKRIYRGLDPTVQPTLSIPPPPLPPPASPQVVTDRVETVQFPKSGTYLVICTIIFHFTPAPGVFEMFGYVRVLP